MYMTVFKIFFIIKGYQTHHESLGFLFETQTPCTVTVDSIQKSGVFFLSYIILFTTAFGLISALCDHYFFKIPYLLLREDCRSRPDGF